MKPPTTMSEEQIRAEIALLHPGETAIITFACWAGLPELMTLGLLATEGMIVIDNSYPASMSNEGWQFWHSRRRRFTATDSISWKRFLEVLDLDKVVHFEEELP